MVRGQSVLLAYALLAAPCPGLRAVEVYAGTVFVDADVRLAAGSLLGVSPRWEVLGERTIFLDGAPGPKLPRPADVECGHRGVDGEPGQSGSPGGTFLGVGAEFSGVDKLTVSVCGGDGGNGGHGAPKGGSGSGGDGADGGAGGEGGPPGAALFTSVSEVR